VTRSVAVVVIFAAGMNDAIPPVPMKIVAGRGTPFHCNVEHGDKLLPFTVRATGGPVKASTAALVGEIELIVGAGRDVPVGKAVTENGTEFEFVAGPVPDTVMATAAAPVAREAVSDAEIAAVSCVALTRVVGRGEPFQLTTSPLANPVPFTVSVNPDGLQYVVLFPGGVAVDEEAESEVTVAKVTGNEIEADALPLNAGVATAICAVPTDAISAAGTMAISWAGLVEVGLT